MKCFCFGNSFELVAKASSSRFFATTKHVKLPISEIKLINGFIEANDLIVCKTLSDAKKLRIAKINIDNSHATTETRDYPQYDYAIYQVEINSPIDDKFTSLKHKSIKQLKSLISFNLCFGAEYFNDRSAIPDIELFAVKKTDLPIQLIACFYFSPINGQQELAMQAPVARPAMS